MRPGDRVAILAERGPDVVIAMLGALRLGAIFVVLDASYPASRLDTLLSLASPRALVSAGSDALHTVGQALARGRDLAITACRSASHHPIDANHLDRADARQPAYMLFTSGSTGTPKCIACSHLPLESFIRWHVETSNLRHDDRFTMLSGLSHDPIMRDVFTPLSIGATLLIPRQATITEPGALARWFADQCATISHLTPQMGQLLTAGGDAALRLPTMRHFFWGGDHLFAALLRTVSRVAPNATHTNFYGCSETPQAVGFYRCGRALKPPPRCRLAKAQPGRG